MCLDRSAAALHTALVVRRRRGSWSVRHRERFRSTSAASAVSSDLSSRLRGSRELFDDAGCLVCGEPLDGREPFWCVAYPKGAHGRCLDWSARPFPFTRHLRVLRRTWRETTHARARREMARAGSFLAALERRFAVGEGNAADVEEARRRLQGLQRYGGCAGVSARLRELV